ncbi:hypothetical protein AVEN_236904-1 [Araneus ventricosus]|uniref:Uncharacterized protein n=1 Tax=Araneus ventricosus TaxID=182803 RepID=A0A4Y2DS23_ARAVE|nr:hypothetical protein AVEN_236904-1 [Araneus ventricosus]
MPEDHVREWMRPFFSIYSFATSNVPFSPFEHPMPSDPLFCGASEERNSRVFRQTSSIKWPRHAIKRPIVMRQRRSGDFAIHLRRGFLDLGIVEACFLTKENGCSILILPFF